MKDKALKILRSKKLKRAISVMLVVALLFGIFPFDGIVNDQLNEKGLGTLTVNAATEHEYPHDENGVVTITMDKLVDYSVDCENDRDYHKNDNLVIKSGGDTTMLSAGFKGLGDSDYPFGGSVTLESENGIVFATLNLDAPLFNCVYDDVVISDGTAPILISREYGSNRVETTPIIAQTVRHRGSGGATWKFNIVKPTDDEGGASYNLDTFGGLIGTMEYDEDTDTGANLNLVVSMNTSGEDTAAATIKGTSDMGFLCGQMQKNTALTATISSDRGVGNITTTSGNVGGLVGSMAERATLTYTGNNLQTVTSGAKNVKTDSSGYAGGIIGKNDRGTASLSISPYPINQVIEGTLGAGGVYGYYKPAGSSDVTLDISKYTIGCSVSGAGEDGGLIGKLECANNVTISGTGTVASDHTSGSANSYGGLIGLYVNDSSHSLTVGSVTLTTAKSGGSAKYYGGCIGKVDDTADSYAVFNSPSITSSNAGALTYGGLVASADNAFIDVNGATVTASSFKGGGLVGSLDHGILRLDGTVNLTAATPTAPTKDNNTDETDYVGKVVGWRDDALVFAKSTCTLTTSEDTVDDIGSWGQVIKFAAEGSENVAALGETAAYTKSIEKLGGAEVLIINETTHAVTIADPSDSTDSYKKIANVADYAKTALCFQIDASNNAFLTFTDTDYNYSTIGSQTISLAASVDLTNTGFVNLTRDNDIGTVNEGTRSYNGDKCTYSGTFDGKPASDQYTVTYGGSTVYRHSYTGLFGITNNATIRETTFAGTLNVNAKETTMYAGSAAGTAKGTFSATDLIVNTTINHAGGSTLYVGGVLGEASSNVGNITVSDITANATITGSASDTCLGGVIGKTSHATNTATVTWSFTDIDISGSISNATALDKNQVGGLIAVISGGSGATSRTLYLNNINVKGLNISVKSNSNGSVGGVLGYSWASVNADFDGVEVGTSVTANNITTVTTPTITQIDNSATGVDFAGLVYSGSGHWTLSGANALKITALKLNSENAQSFGMIANRGWIGNSDMTAINTAMFLDIQNSTAYSITASNVKFKKRSDGNTDTDMTIPVFDELVAHTAFYTGTGVGKQHYSGDSDNLYIIQNGQAVVSIETGAENGGLTMDGSSASGTYTPFTDYGKQMNPCARYYYNLHTIKTGTGDADKLMSWGAKWYSHSSIEDDVSSNSWGTTVPSGTYDMAGYSWYPLNIDSSTVSINGTFKLYNREFEASDNYTTDGHVKRTSLYDGGTTQHYLMHSALFNNVKGKLNAGNVTLQGSIPLIDTRTYEEVEGVQTQTGGNLYSGALVLGSVTGTGATESTTAKVTTTSVTLDGVYVYNFDLSYDDYAPLLINKSGSYSTLTINGVKVNADSSYKSNSNLLDKDGNLKKDGSFPKIATSLIGNAGVDKNSKNVNVNFTNIQLDGRKTNIVDALDSAYHTQVSLFTKATLLNKLTFDTGKGTYTFKQGDDWGAISESNSSPKHFVTYGKELGYTDAVVYESTQYPNQERWYLDTNPGTYVNPTTSSDSTGEYLKFVSSYLPYVAYEYHNTDHPYWYQLEVNHASSTFSGCGTYNDPYLLTSGTDFNTIYSILNTSDDGNPGNISICIPKSSASAVGLSSTWHNPSYGHTSYTFLGADNSDPTNHPAGYYANGVYVNKTDTNNYLTQEKVRIYVAGAYFKLKPANDSEGNPSNNITISSGTFKGLGDTTDSKAQFRGVIVGTGNETIINKSGYPLIAYSNGSVVKDINIIVDMNTASAGSPAETGDIGRSMASAMAYDAEGGGANYGAVFGSVLGGDNIIDGVTVTFQNTTITLSDDYAQLIPIGGYVGVVLNGGVIFRGMEDKSSGISGLPTGVVTAGSTPGVGDASLGDMTSETNKRWLYVNPIIGRVINGYAVNEASAYRPYEDGTRTYKGGTEDEIKYWDETNQTEVTTAPTSLSHVTMQNGNKHYSIADIDDGLTLLLTASSASKITVPNGQAFFIMSLLVNSGESYKNLGFNQKYQVNRLASYSNVMTNTSAAEPTTACDYYTYAKNDRVDSTNSTEANRKAKQTYGYLFSAYYSNKYNNNYVGLTNADRQIELSGNIYLPDGYKGIGNIYNNTYDNAYYNMKITEFDGKNYTVSMNSSWYYYFTNDSTTTQNINSKTINVWNQPFDTLYTHGYKAENNGNNVGFGLINNQVKEIATSGSGVSQVFSGKGYHNVTIKGNVIVDCIATDSNTGSHILYYCGNNSSGAGGHTCETGVDRATMVNAGGLIGVSDKALYINSVSVNNLYVHGVKNAGGLVGCVPAAQITINNTDSKASEKIRVYAAGSAGGMIGKVQQGGNNGINIDNNNATYSITEVKSECYSRKNVSDFNYGVGGFIGACRTQDKPINISNIVVGSPTQDKASSVHAAEEIFAGGMIGIINKGTVTINNCTVNNQSVSSKSNAGGLIGYWASPQDATQNIKNVVIYAKNYTNASDIPVIESTKANAGGFLGTGKGDMRTTIIQNSSVEGYSITAKTYAGGAIGSWGDGQSESDGRNVSLNNIMIKGCTIKADYSGGLLGRLYTDDNKTKTLSGYNILVKNTELQTTKTSNIDNYIGSICGLRQNNKSKTYNSIIKIAGFSRQDDRTGTNNKMVKSIVGSPVMPTEGTDVEKMTGYFGTNGYVIFADYNDYASSSTYQNKLFSNVSSTGTNVLTMRSKTQRTVQTTISEPEIEDVVTTTSSIIYDDYSDEETATGTTTRTVVTEETISYDSTAGKWKITTTVTTNGTEGSPSTADLASARAALYTDTSQTITIITTDVINNENYPYVTSSRKGMIDSVNYITGDGMAASTPYTSSNFYKIINDTSNKSYTLFKRYGDSAITTDVLTDSDISEIKAHYSSTSAAYNNNANVLNFPLLVVDDVNTTNTTRLINNYINVLANTNYNYADTSNSTIYNVDFYKYRLDTDSQSDTYKQFKRITSGNPCLSKGTETSGSSTKYVFKMSADNVDTGSTPQFTLMDVQYYDPSGSGSIAYHLYIPVYVNQILRYDYNASVVSNTDYYRSAYYDSETGKAISQYMFENLGNAVTMEFEYDYRRSPSEWAEAINGGVNVLSNYYKTLNLNTRGQGWPADTRLVLVDASNKDKAYYLDDPATKCGTYIDLYDFLEKDGTTHYAPAPLQNLMSLGVVSTISGNLVATTSTDTNAVVSVNGTYYRPITETDTDTSKYVRIVASMFTEEVAGGASGELIKITGSDYSNATVSDGTSYYRPATDSEKADTSVTKYNTESSRFDSERYYLSFFTKESDVSTIYHFEIQTRDTFEETSLGAKTSTGTSEWTVSGWQPNKLYGSNTTVDIVLGNLYDNDMKLDVTPMIKFTQANPTKPQLMNEDNYYLTIKMTSTVKLKDTAITAGVASNLSKHPEATIYQTFLMKYDKLDTVGGQSEIGLDYRLDTRPSEMKYYLKAGNMLDSYTASDYDDITSEAEAIKEASTHIELRNNQNLVTYLADSTNSNAVTLQVKYDMVYSSSELSYQFPVRENDGDAIGSKVIGYSNISSSKTGAAYSSTSISKEDHQKQNGDEDGYRYYTDDDTKATLTYDVVPVDKLDDLGTPNSEVYGGKYSYLGINAYETNKTSLFVDTYAIYDVRELQNPGDYIELTLSLSRKGSYLKPAAGDPHVTGNALDITTYLKNLKIYGKTSGGTKDVLYDMNQDTAVNTEGTGNSRINTLTGSLNSDKNQITLRVHKSLLQTQGDSSSNIYMIPISFEVITGDSTFKNGGLKYSNYKVSITAATYSNMTTGNYADSSYAYNHLIYTNAKLDPEVMDH